ncbi:MAG: catalase [Clostridiales bacterium]|jgi:catalase|nr:catalase [Clostridiales bacterium]
MQANDEKLSQLEKATVTHASGRLTTNQGLGVSNTDDSLKAGKRGKTLMEDFMFREKITHFDHERIPERIVHARGSGAHGYFQVYKSLSNITKAHFLSDPSLKTPVFARFSTVAGFRGSADTVRDIRGFAVKFYTKEGNYDIVGNNMPVFFLQDAIKFPDLIHAVKPEPNNEMPQAASAHDTFWDFVTSTPETMHNLMWLMSPRALPQSYRMMEGFGIHTFRFVNEAGESKFVKFHWKPLLGLHSLVWDEAQTIAGKDGDFNRRDLWDNIENGNFAEFEFGIQVLDPQDEFKFDFDILDPTKLWPEEMIPVQRVGKLTLNKNPENFFAETEQVAFCPANIVPGIDFTNDPLLQGRLFSYLDTQLSRLGGPNFHQIPINRPLVDVNNNQRDGIHRMTIDKGQTAYYPNSLNNNEPHAAGKRESHFEHFMEKIDGQVIRERSESFRDHYSQPAMFWNSMSDYEKQHLIDAFAFELGKCKTKEIRQKAVDMITNIDMSLACQVANKLGITPNKDSEAARAGQTNFTVSDKSLRNFVSSALSEANTPKSAKTAKVAVVIEDGYNASHFDAVTRAITDAGATFDVVSSKLGRISSADGKSAEANQTLATTSSVFYNAVFVPCGKEIDNMGKNRDLIHFLGEAYRHYKTIGLAGEATTLADAAGFDDKTGIVMMGEPVDTFKLTSSFITSLAEGRHYTRQITNSMAYAKLNTL